MWRSLGLQPCRAHLHVSVNVAVASPSQVSSLATEGHAALVVEVAPGT
jgi:hypothetical protein